MQTANDITSPSRRTRQQEKEELQHLNDRFVTYIDHVRRLREEKTRVDTAFEQLRNTTFEESSQVKRVYDRELDDARLLIDETAKEKARFQLQASKNAEKVATLENELKELSEEFSKLQQELSDAKLNIEDSERQRCSLNQERVASQHKIQELEDELEDLRAQVRKLQEMLEQETLLKVDLKNQIQSLKEDSVFRKKVYEEELIKRRTEVVTDGSRVIAGGVEETDDDFSERLQAAIDEARDEIDRETEQFKKDLEKAYRAKLDMLEKQTSLDSTTITRQNTEIRQLNSSLVQVNKTVSSLQDDKDRLEILLRERMEELGTIKELHSDELSRLMQDMRMLRVNYEEKIKEYEELLDLRVKLEQEIATLSALLQEEENRLNISTPTREKRKRPADKDGPKTKKKKQVDVKSSNSAGFIQICDVDPDGRYVQIKNMSDKIEALGSFKIVHEVEDTGEKVEFRFHNKSKLQGGASVTVWARDADGATHNPPSEIIWKAAGSWGSGPRTLTSLCTKNGEIVATFTQRKEISITETSQTDNDIELDQTDSGSHSFPYIPASSPERVRQAERTSTPAVRPRPLQQVVRDEHIFHQQEDPVGERQRENCVVC